MDFFSLIMIAVGLSMDAFAVSISNALCYPNAGIKKYATAALSFGIFQGLMPLIGFYAGISFSTYIKKYDHWITLIVLGFIGINMICEAIKEIRHPEQESAPKELNLKTILAQAVATSIDALAVGVSLSLSNDVNIWFNAGIIAAITGVLSLIAHFIGSKVGNIFKEKAQIFGGVILVLIGLRIFIIDMIGG